MIPILQMSKLRLLKAIGFFSLNVQELNLHCLTPDPKFLSLGGIAQIAFWVLSVFNIFMLNHTWKTVHQAKGKSFLYCLDFCTVNFQEWSLFCSICYIDITGKILICCTS